MSTRRTLLLALVTAAAAFVYLSAKPESSAPVQPDTLLGEPRAIDPTAIGKHILEFDPAQLTRIILRSGGRQLAAARAANTWRRVARADVMDDFVQALKDLVLLTTIASPGAHLADYGLDKPAREVTLERSDGPPIRLAIGDRNPATTAVYVRANTGPVLLAGSLLLWEFDKAFTALTKGAAHG